MSAPTRLFLLRHAEVEERYHRVFGGRIDMDLSQRGHTQANALAKYLSKIPFDAIYASPMKRAQQTLAPILAERASTPVLIDDLRECHFGDWTGMTWQQVHDKYQVSAFHWLDMMEQAKIPNGECSRTFRARVEPHLKSILEAHAGKTVAIMCHGGVVRMLLSVLLDVPLPKLAMVNIEYASLTEVHYSSLKTEVQLLNLTPWRDIS
ncbi:MAG: phosphoglycerate mutase/fructose-2,6-bisphosphatase [Verrucomicrobiales bacterium]|nr:phosphoglycerate mutase/fructose-2,6-bisphosphatase [Verrucomicrobiales bacterium]